MNKRTFKLIILSALAFLVLLLLIGFVQSLIINSLDQKQKYLNNELEKSNSQYEYVQKQSYKDAFLKEEGYGSSEDIIYQTKSLNN